MRRSKPYKSGYSSQAPLVVEKGCHWSSTPRRCKTVADAQNPSLSTLKLDRQLERSICLRVHQGGHACEPLAVRPFLVDFPELMVDLQTGLQNITAGQGLAITAVGMTIVFAALSMISLFIARLPGLLRLVAVVFPEAVAATPRPKVETDDLPAVAAAAAAAYHVMRGAGVEWA